MKFLLVEFSSDVCIDDKTAASSFMQILSYLHY